VKVIDFTKVRQFVVDCRFVGDMDTFK